MATEADKHRIYTSLAIRVRRVAGMQEFES